MYIYKICVHIAYVFAYIWGDHILAAFRVYSYVSCYHSWWCLGYIYSTWYQSRDGCMQGKCLNLYYLSSPLLLPNGYKPLLPMTLISPALWADSRRLRLLVSWKEFLKIDAWKGFAIRHPEFEFQPLQFLYPDLWTLLLWADQFSFCRMRPVPMVGEGCQKHWGSNAPRTGLWRRSRQLVISHKSPNNND